MEQLHAARSSLGGPALSLKLTPLPALGWCIACGWNPKGCELGKEEGRLPERCRTAPVPGSALSAPHPAAAQGEEPMPW